MRWEMLRQGREDYEYLTMLERLVDGREGEGKGREHINQLIEQAVWGSLDWQYDPDPLVAHHIRRQVAGQIAALQG